MRIPTAWWATSDDEKEARREVRAQALAWADAEPNVVSAKVLKISRPYPDRAFWYEIVLDLQFRETAVQPTLWGEAA